MKRLYILAALIIPLCLFTMGAFFGLWKYDGSGNLTPAVSGKTIAVTAIPAHTSSHTIGGADAVYPADPGADRYLMWDDDPGVLVWSAGAGGADDMGEVDTVAEFVAALSDEGAFADDLLGYADAAAVLAGIGAEPAFTVVQLDSGANPTTDAEGELSWDSDDDMFEVYDGAASKALPIKQMKEVTIFEPDQVNDQIPFFHCDSSIYPHGITVIEYSITIPADAEYSMVFEEWAGDPPAAQNDSDTVATGATDSYKSETTISDAAIDAGDYIFLDIPVTDVDWIMATCIFTVNEGD